MNTRNTFPYTRRLMAVLTGVALASFSCTAQQAQMPTQVASTSPMPSSTSTVAAAVTPTNTAMPTYTPAPTSTPTRVPTPTVPASWGQPGFIWRIADADYYQQLLLSVNDSDTLVQITGVGGGLMRLKCTGCEFNVGTFLWAVYIPKNTSVYMDFAVIFRYPIPQAAQAAIQERVNRYLADGYVQAEIPDSISLSPETVVLAVRNAARIIARYGVFEVLISQGSSDTQLPLEDSIRLTYHLAEIQIAKLKQAGY